MIADNKEHYINEWKEHVKSLNILMMCPNVEHSNEIKAIRDRLYKLIELVAADKYKEVEKDV